MSKVHRAGAARHLPGRRPSAAVLTVVPGILALSAGAFAAEERAAAGVLEEILVTAQFRAERLQDTPIAITAVSAAMLEQRSQTSIQEVASQAPNVTLTRASAAFGPSVSASIRGIGQYDFNPALEPGVGMYVDDVYYATMTGTIFDLLDLERVEILRGPQGTLAGKNSIGGAVKLFSKRPTGDNSGSLEVAYGSYNRTDVRASGDFAIVPDKLMVRLSGVTKQRDGFFDVLDYGCLNPGEGIPARNSTADCKVGEQSSIDYSGARASLLWVASDSVDVSLIADYTHDNSSPPGNVLIFANNPSLGASQYPGVSYDSRFVPTGKAYHNYSTFNTPDGTFVHTVLAGIAAGGAPIPVSTAPITGLFLSNRSSFQGWGVSGKVDWSLSDNLVLTSVTAYREYDASWSTDGDYSPLQTTLGHDDLSNRQFSQELRLNGTAGAVDYTFGGFYIDQTSLYKTHQLILYVPVFPLDFLGSDPVTAETKAVFAHASWHITDNLNLTTGVRYTDESKEYTFSRRNRDGTVHSIPWDIPPSAIIPVLPDGGLGELDGRVGAYSGSKTDYRVSLDYRWSRDFMTYAQVATGFKGGGVGPRPFNPQQVQPFGPEEVTAYELGFKSDLLGGTIRLNGAVFFNDYQDIQLTFLSCPQFGGPGPCALPQNAGDGEIKGAELEIEAHPFGGLSFDASVSYLEFEYKRIDPLAGGIDANGAPYGVQLEMITPFTPEWKWSAGLQYEFGLGNAGSLTPRVDAAYQGKMFSNAVNGQFNELDSRTLTNARLTWMSPAATTSASLEVTNLTDKYYYVSKFDLVGPAGIASAQVGAPRMWAVTLKHRF